MSRKIVFRRAKAGGRPAVRVEFKGKYQEMYFSLRNIAEVEFGIRQTQLARMILCEWVSLYESKISLAARGRIIEQLKLNFGEGPKKGGKNGGS
jgi:hypothetical protein